MSESGRLAAVGDRRGRIRLVDLQRRVELRVIEAHADRVTGLAFTDGSTIISASMDFTLCAWSTTDGRRLRRGRNETGVLAFAATPDGRLGVSGTQVGRLHVWDLRRLRRLASFPHQAIGQNSTVMAVAITPDGAHALSGGDDHLIRAWDLASGRSVATFVAEDFTTCAAAASPNLFVAGYRNGAVHLLALSPAPGRRHGRGSH
jgi:WD40 repeat protein